MRDESCMREPGWSRRQDMWKYWFLHMFLAFKGQCGHWDRWVTGAWGVVGLIDGGFSRQSVLSKMVSTIISMEVLWFHVIFSFGEFHWVVKGSG